MRRSNETESNSGGQDMPQTPAGSTSPLHQERIAQQENTDDKPVIMACTPIPGHPGKLLCNFLMPETEVQKALSSVTMPVVDTPPGKSDKAGSGTPDSGVETWIRGDGKTIDVRRIECDRRVVFEPIDTPVKPQSGDPQVPQSNTKQDPSAGRTQSSQFGGRIKTTCKLPRMHSPTRVRQNDQKGEGM